MKLFKTLFLLNLCLLTGVLAPDPSFGQGGSARAVADTIDLVPGLPSTYDLLANDTIMANDTLKSVDIVLSDISCVKIHGSKWIFKFSTPFGKGSREVQGNYRLQTMSGDTSWAQILVRVYENGYDYLDINNVRAKFNAFGCHFFGHPAQFEVPKGSGKTSVFVNGLWIGGKDSQNHLHFAGIKYGDGNAGNSWTRFDFFAGPVMDSSAYSIQQDTLWNHVWNLKKTDIGYHRAHCWEAGYHPIRDILTWPGNGDTTAGQAWRLAPFCDRNGDGKYDPFDGDYPEIRGDQALWFIFNDDRAYHAESRGAKLKVEVHGMAYAFDMPDDTAFKNTVFLNYRIFNRSQNTYDSTLFGIFTDIDVGYAPDDYTGCDVERGMCFCYNGKPVDGTGQTYAYGANPPAQSATLLGGPLMDADGIDNPKYDNNGAQLCNASVNGLNFGDSIADNERLGLQGYMVPLSDVIVPLLLDPHDAEDYYRVMSGRFIYYGTHLVYGGAGHLQYGGYGPDCNFMFPGESDTLNWGAGCMAPNGPANWTTETASLNPGDYKGTGVTGPVTFKPGDMQELDMAFSWARDYINPDPHASLDKLRIVTDHIRKSFETNTLPNGGPFYGIGDHWPSNDIPIRVYPNPASDYVILDFGQSAVPADAMLELMTSQGICMKHIALRDRSNTIRIGLSGLPAGYYFLRISSDATVVMKQLVIVH